MALAVLVTAGACGGGGDSLGTVVDEEVLVASDSEDVQVSLGTGADETQVALKAGSLVAGTRVKVTLLAGVSKKGASPVAGKTLQVSPKGIPFARPASMSRPLAPPASGRIFTRLRAFEADASWTIGPAATPSVDGLAFAVDVDGAGLWSMAEIDGAAPGIDAGADLAPDAGAPDGPDDAAADGGGSEGPASEATPPETFLPEGSSDAAAPEAPAAEVDDAPVADAGVIPDTPVGGDAADASLIGHWLFDEGAGTTATDVSPGGRDGVLTGSTGVPTWIAGHAGGSALGFSSAGAQKVAFAGTGSLHLMTGMTLMIWFKVLPGVVGGLMGRLDCSAFQGFGLRSYNGGVDFVLSGTVFGTPTALYSDGVWHHAAATWDGTTARLYVDGVEVKSGPLSYTMTSTSELVVGNVGSLASCATRFFTGSLDEPALHDRALAAGEILAAYLGMGGTPADAGTGDGAAADAGASD